MVELLEDGDLKETTWTPCGLTPVITCSIALSFPAASIACRTTSSAYVSLAQSSSCALERSSTPRARQPVDQVEGDHGGRVAQVSRVIGRDPADVHRAVPWGVAGAGRLDPLPGGVVQGEPGASAGNGGNVRGDPRIHAITLTTGPRLRASPLRDQGPMVAIRDRTNDHKSLIGGRGGAGRVGHNLRATR